jgi:hypothetical protein
MFCSTAGPVAIVRSVDAFKELLSRVARRFESKKALADALQMDSSRLSRAINTGDFPFNVENCLRLAQVSGEPASAVLRAAGKGDIAELIESLYGPEKAVSEPLVLRLLRHWPTFTGDEKAVVRTTVGFVIQAKRARGDGPAVDAIQHTHVSGSHTATAAAVESTNKDDGRDLASLDPPVDQANPVPRAPRPRAQTLAAFKKATAEIEAADTRKARRHAAATRVRAAGGGPRGRKPRR